MLTADLSHEEINTTLPQMHPLKSPCPDGYGRRNYIYIYNINISPSTSEAYLSPYIYTSKNIIQIILKYMQFLSF
jgi:hypothetical protein